MRSGINATAHWTRAIHAASTMTAVPLPSIIRVAKSMK